MGAPANVLPYSVIGSDVGGGPAHDALHTEPSGQPTAGTGSRSAAATDAARRAPRIINRGIWGAVACVRCACSVAGVCMPVLPDTYRIRLNTVSGTVRTTEHFRVTRICVALFFVMRVVRSLVLLVSLF